MIYYQSSSLEFLWPDNYHRGEDAAFSNGLFDRGDYGRLGAVPGKRQKAMMTNNDGVSQGGDNGVDCESYLNMGKDVNSVGYLDNATMAGDGVGGFESSGGDASRKQSLHDENNGHHGSNATPFTPSTVEKAKNGQEEGTHTRSNSKNDRGTANGDPRGSRRDGNESKVGNGAEMRQHTLIYSVFLWLLLVFDIL